jgi:hypothetical protein
MSIPRAQPDELNSFRAAVVGSERILPADDRKRSDGPSAQV